MEFVGNSLRPGFDLLVRGQIVPCVSSLFIPEPPSAIVGLLITIRSSREASYGDIRSVAICVAVRAFAYSLARLDHVGQGSDIALAKDVAKAELSSKAVLAGLRLLRSQSGPRCRVCGEARGPLQVQQQQHCCMCSCSCSSSLIPKCSLRHSCFESHRVLSWAELTLPLSLEKHLSAYASVSAPASSMIMSELWSNDNRFCTVFDLDST